MMSLRVGRGGPPGAVWATGARDDAVLREEVLEIDSTRSSSSFSEDASESRSASVSGRWVSASLCRLPWECLRLEGLSSFALALEGCCVPSGDDMAQESDANRGDLTCPVYRMAAA